MAHYFRWNYMYILFRQSVFALSSMHCVLISLRKFLRIPPSPPCWLKLWIEIPTAICSRCAAGRQAEFGRPATIMSQLLWSFWNLCHQSARFSAPFARFEEWFHLLDALKLCNHNCSVVMLTTDKMYANLITLSRVGFARWLRSMQC